eukprot:TRINITY_DN9883_c0_g2_i2.p1 TRINITY_DN9883_c0_g2~~TRINITY_DN9883_c0_g2_i2.p1  ORF type:complete len:183 (+),score=35.06 TRINITY_DN9883_c0_g2_i2:93-641(+)
MIRRPPRSTQGVSSAASDVYKRQISDCNRILDKIADDEVRASRLLEETDRDKKETANQVAELETRVDALSDELEVLNQRVSELRSVLNEDEFNLLTDKLQKAQSSYNDTSRRYENKVNDLSGLNLERQHFKQNVEQITRERTALEGKKCLDRPGDRGLLCSCLLYTSPSPRDLSTSRMPSSA